MSEAPVIGGRLLRFTEVKPIEGAPPADRVIAGDPRFRTWPHYKSPDGLMDGTIRAGQWEATPGTWRIAYTRWEFMRILSGRCIIRGEDGTVVELGPGDVFVIEPGFTGSWEVVETMLKDYVLK